MSSDEIIHFGTCDKCGTSGQIIPGTNGREFDIRPVSRPADPNAIRERYERACGQAISQTIIRSLLDIPDLLEAIASLEQRAGIPNNNGSAITSSPSE